MDAADYKIVYEKALSELSDLMDRREQLDIERDSLDGRIREIRQGVEALAPLAKENPRATHSDLFPEAETPTADIGLTDAIRTVLSNTAPNWLTPVGIRTGLSAAGYEIKSKNILPSIHRTIKRLEGKEIESKDIEGRTWYRWSAPPYQSPKSGDPTIDNIGWYQAEQRKAAIRKALEGSSQPSELTPKKSGLYNVMPRDDSKKQ